jgi:glycosyltransferase involved in cell wall biosynthesis
LGVADRIDFVGAKTNDQVRELMVDAMVCVLPCKPADDGDRDGIPVVLMEAMARGVAVISGDLPTIRELIADGESGLMVPPGNSEALAEAIGDLLSQSETRQRLAAAGRTRVEEEFSLSVTLDRLIAAFRRAAEVYDKNPAVVRSHRHD